MARALVFKTNRSYYGCETAVEDSISVRELKQLLENYDEDEKVVFSNDNGYTYGFITKSVVSEIEYETAEESDAREYRETMEELNDELNELQARYENGQGDDADEPMTDDEFERERGYLFNLYGVTEEEYDNFRF